MAGEPMMRRIIKILIALRLSLLFSAAMCASTRLAPPTIKFQEASSADDNPDRGMFSQLRLNNSLEIPSLDAHVINHRVYFVIDKFIETPLPDTELLKLGESLATLQRAKQRVIVRFIYDYPSEEFVKSGLSQRPARTASPSIMSIHIRQLAAVLRIHKDAVFAVESGLIGFWGEQHGDTSDKQTPEGVAAVVDQWRTALAGTEIQVLARYPKNLRNYIQQRRDISRKEPRLGFWNDCLGAYDDDNTSSVHVDVVEGETCSLRPYLDYSCSTMKAHFQAIHLDLLNSGYFSPTIDGWRAEGCLDEIKKKLGYRYVIRSVTLATDGLQIELHIDNVGWGRSHVSRPLYLVSDGHRIQKIGDLKNFSPGSTNRIHVVLHAPLSLGSDNLSLETDDKVRFSNVTGNALYIPAQLH